MQYVQYPHQTCNCPLGHLLEQPPCNEGCFQQTVFEPRRQERKHFLRTAPFKSHLQLLWHRDLHSFAAAEVSPCFLSQNLYSTDATAAMNFTMEV